MNYLFGKKALFDAINNHLQIDRVYLLNSKCFDVKLLELHRIRYEFKNIYFFNVFNEHRKCNVVFKLEKSKNNVNFKDVIKDVQNKEDVLILILDSIQDVGNLGGILRSADAFGVDFVIYKKNNQADPFNPAVIKTSTNAISYLKMCEVSNLNYALEQLKEIGVWIYASAIDRQSISYLNEKYTKKTAIILGNENCGVSSLLKKNSDQIIHIPQIGHVQSLNVSVAAGILLANYRSKWHKKI